VDSSYKDAPTRNIVLASAALLVSRIPGHAAALEPSPEENRRVLAVLAFLRG
jgi:hypothetical protein